MAEYNPVSVRYAERKPREILEKIVKEKRKERTKSKPQL